MKKSSQQRIRNWREYNENLVARGRVTLWVDAGVRNAWYNEKLSGKRGASITYSDEAILFVLMLQAVYHLPLRGAEGMAQSLFGLMGITLDIPDYSTVSRRRRYLEVPLSAHQRADGHLHIVVDSTGFKVYGEGEWKVRKHGWCKRRTWRKLHIAVDESSGEILSAVGTGNNIADKEVLQELLDDVEVPIEQVSGDGGYDKATCYETINDRGARAVIPPQRNARIWRHDPRWEQRNENIYRIREIETEFEDKEEGRKRWKEETNYHRRSLVETTMMRLKKILGERLTPRIPHAQDVELLLRCRILNKMTQLGMPPYSEK